MADQVASLNNIKKDIDLKESQIDKLRNNQSTTQAEVEKAEKQLAKIVHVMDEYTVCEFFFRIKISMKTH